MDGDGPHLVAIGQFFLLLFLAVCIALHPGFVFKRDESGMSNYGIHIKTAFPYSLALISAAFYSLRATAHIHAHHRVARQFRMTLRLYALALILVLLSTYAYKLNSFLDDVHVAANAFTAILETVATVWMYRTFDARRTMVVPFLVELTGAVLVASTTTNSLHLLFLAEVLLGVGFGLMVIHASRSLASPSRARILTMHPAR